MDWQTVLEGLGLAASAGVGAWARSSGFARQLDDVAREVHGLRMELSMLPCRREPGHCHYFEREAPK